MKRSNNNVNRERKEKMIVKNYQKRCSTAREAFDALCSAHPEIEEVLYPTIIIDEENGKVGKVELKESILDSMMENVISYVDFKRPCIEQMTNMSISLNYKPNKVQIKTDKYIGFGWYVKYNKVSRTEATIEEVDINITLSGQRSVDENEEYLLNNGWEEVRYEK